MKRIFTIFLAISAFISSNAQTVTFDDLPLMPPQQSWSGMGTLSKDSLFQSGQCKFPNYYTWDTSGGGLSYWSGWGYSNKKDTTTHGYLNDMSCIVGKGHNNSSNYGVAYMNFIPSKNKIILPIASTPQSMYVTNSTYAYLSMKDGLDSPAKQFGGVTGNDPDFLLLNITGWLNGVAKTDTIHFYLADFRDSNNANDYIVKDWRMINLSALGICDSLIYNMISSDNSSGFLNTPAYFCMDDLSFAPLATNELVKKHYTYCSPNPCGNSLQINSSEKINRYVIRNISGQAMLKNVCTNQTINVQSLSIGIYIIELFAENNQMMQTSFIKN
jgi:hypothetical protein